MRARSRAAAKDRTPLYDQIARRYATAIESGTFVPVNASRPCGASRRRSGRRSPPSCRPSRSSRPRARRGAASLRPLRAAPRAAPAPRPAAPPASAAASHVEVAELVARVYHAARDPTLVNLGQALPEPALLPTRPRPRHRHGGAPSRRRGASYEMPPGLLELRRAIARRALTWGCTLAEDDPRHHERRDGSESTFASSRWCGRAGRSRWSRPPTTARSRRWRRSG
jgi:DNA-binding transcriptional MocR family regulator